jgi:hypothetical protein
MTVPRARPPRRRVLDWHGGQILLVMALLVAAAWWAEQRWLDAWITTFAATHPLVGNPFADLAGDSRPQVLAGLHTRATVWTVLSWGALGLAATLGVVWASPWRQSRFRRGIARWRPWQVTLGWLGGAAFLWGLTTLADQVTTSGFQERANLADYLAGKTPAATEAEFFLVPSTTTSDLTEADDWIQARAAYLVVRGGSRDTGLVSNPDLWERYVGNHVPADSATALVKHRDLWSPSVMWDHLVANGMSPDSATALAVAGPTTKPTVTETAGRQRGAAAVAAGEVPPATKPRGNVTDPSTQVAAIAAGLAEHYTRLATAVGMLRIALAALLIVMTWIWFGERARRNPESGE